ncbi:NAD-dependent malic enzyme [Vibrio sp. SS-MA-C1-2]|uniref:NAD-dependent malic enzyme n=1 Tax=Vibrio sp. SS-MA-C1-2 TaxID=2908646 RepID=UPI001F262C67|nr:NAD-dependent malic enzyme [Vibrio sp. SS-MA-C1-2]UJF17437.1 NAD-dependent malic enzyme [Vibrio sp. SS-MA-C1-2]
MKIETKYIRQAGNTLLHTPLLNKGNAFSASERKQFNLIGLLPECIETIEEQAHRSYVQYSTMVSPMRKHIFLRQIQDTNETLYYRLINNHVEEMMPIIYTPTVGDACQRFSEIYRRNRGIFLSIANKYSLDEIINNAPNQDVKVIVITDGERILGLGDQGIGGMGIPIGKLALYTACGGINPEHTLPIVIDVGTNNSALLSDELYMGSRNQRISGDEYNDFINNCIKALTKRWPKALIQFEDFAQTNAMPILQRYKDQICCFNDDIQGTAAISVGTILSAAKKTGKKLSEQKVVFSGAGSAGCGIAEAIISQMISEGISEEQARSQIFMIDRWGLLDDSMTNLINFQQPLAQKQTIRDDWGIDKTQQINLIDVIKAVNPDILIGVTGVAGLFTKEIIEAMAAGCEQPLIMPLSNPTSRVEAKPSDIINWTKGTAIVATGSPFDDVMYDGQKFPIAQCNNSYIFPGIGLAVIASKAKRVTEQMLQESSIALADYIKDSGSERLLPPLAEIQQVSKYIALRVALKAMEQGVATKLKPEAIEAKIEEEFWMPEYCDYRRIAS